MGIKNLLRFHRKYRLALKSRFFINLNGLELEKKLKIRKKKIQMFY